MGMTIMSI